MSRSILLSTAAILAIGGAATAQWSHTTPATSPSARGAAAMTFDATAGRVLLFGGVPAFPGTPLADTWSFDGSNWTLLSPLASPSGRAQTGLTYDLARGVAVMYGGGNTSFFGGPSLDQTWEFDGVTWSQITTVNSPGGLANMGACYDVIRQRTVIYGGDPDSFFPIASNQTWEYNGIDWTLVTTATDPGPLERPGMCFDIGLQRVVMFGGIDPQTGGTDNTWTYDGVDWTMLAVAGPRPSARTGCQMVYDPARSVCILHGGMDPMTGSPFTDTWEFDGTSWRQVGGAQPAPRVFFAMAMNQATGRAVVFGGNDPVSFSELADTWQYGADYHAFGSGCSGSNGVPTLAGSGAPHIGTTFTVNVTNLSASASAFMLTGISSTNWSGLPLPADLTPFGLTGCTAYVSGDLISVLAPTAGSAALQLPLPMIPTLVGMPFYNQAISIDAAANPAGLTVSNAGAGIVGN